MDKLKMHTPNITKENFKNEQENLKKICSEIFGAMNFVAIFPWRKRIGKSDVYKKYYEENRIVFSADYDFFNIKKPVLRYWKEDDMKVM